MKDTATILHHEDRPYTTLDNAVLQADSLSVEERAVKKLKALYEDLVEPHGYYGGDNERAHIDADEALADFLEEAGYEELAKTYRKMMEDIFWYA